MAVYEKYKSLALRQIEKYGTTISIKRKTLTSVEGKPWEPPTVTDVTYSALALILEYDSREIDGSIIQQNDRKVMIPSKGIPVLPSMADIIKVGETDYSVQNIKTLAPANEPIIYTLQIRVV